MSLLIPIATMAAFAALVLAFASGCGSRTVLVRHGDPIRIGPNATGPVYVRTEGEWRLSGNRVTLPEGWYVVPPDYVDVE